MVKQCRSCSRVPSPHPFSQLRPHPPFRSHFFLCIRSSWRHGGGAVAFRAEYSCTTRIAPTSGSKGRRCNRRYSTRLLGFDPDSLHFVTTCSFPPGSFLGAIQRLFFDVRYARPSAVAQRHIGAACWLVTARLYNLKRPKSQFYSAMRAFCMIGIRGR